MRGQANESKTKAIGVTLLLERPTYVDQKQLIDRVGQALNITSVSVHPKLEDPMVLVSDGDWIAGLNVEIPYPESLNHFARFAYRWPDAGQEVARHQAHLMVIAEWPKFSRLDAHIRHAVLLNELIEQLPVIGILWGSVLIPPHVFKAEFAAAQQGRVPFSLWVLIQYSKRPNGNVLISTLGMDQFGYDEIETESALSLHETYDLVHTFGSYILTTGATVADREVITLGENRRIKVRRARSFRPDITEKVYWLDLAQSPSIQRSRSLFSETSVSTQIH